MAPAPYGDRIVRTVVLNPTGDGLATGCMGGLVLILPEFSAHVVRGFAAEDDIFLAGFSPTLINGDHDIGGHQAFAQSLPSLRLVSHGEALPHAACDPLQNGLLSDLPHRHKVTRFRIEWENHPPPAYAPPGPICCRNQARA